VTRRQRQERIKLIRRHYGMSATAAAQVMREDRERSRLLARGKLSLNRLLRETRTPRTVRP
jgi:hypothetical protein